MQHDEHIYDCQRHPLIPIDGASLDEGQKRFEELCEEAAATVSDKIYQILEKALKEAPTMKVEYNGFTGELVKLEREEGFCEATITNGGAINAIYQVPKTETRYGLSIYDSEKRVTHTFDGVKLEDVKFLGGEVSFGG